MPPLDYGLVYRLKAAWPGLQIVLNGGVPDLDAAISHLQHVDGVMLGRAAYHAPGLLGQVDRRVFGEGPEVTALQAVEAYRPYMAKQLARGVPLNAMTRHMLGLFAGQPGARTWRRRLTEGAGSAGGLEVLDAALDAVVGAAELAA